MVNYNRFLLLVAGLGGLLYGVDVGIIAGALPYLESTSGLSAGLLSFIVAAVAQIQKYLVKGQTIILESTTYPGTTEELLIPQLRRGDRRFVYDRQRRVVRREHSNDRAGARL